MKLVTSGVIVKVWNSLSRMKMKVKRRITVVLFIQTKGKAYSCDIRRLIYKKQFVCDVPVKNCDFLISVFSQIICKSELKDTSPTCAQTAYELGVITTIQVMECILTRGQQVCLSWDATTTIEGYHGNEIHLTVNRTNCMAVDDRHLPGGKTSDYVTHMALDDRHLPGGKTSDYVTHIVSALTGAADV
ncbi:hypothetical protein ElyMa_000201600 [Elysia marginata]|uniref:Uncharacterized protein n=1 Tax=Elysia marginata TaxID=1093978 RepID=A0AAV4EXA2_9GAST|nr:hypothetical protein ElyMa_000201600 [Elysia marginata]